MPSPGALVEHLLVTIFSNKTPGARGGSFQPSHRPQFTTDTLTMEPSLPELERGEHPYSTTHNTGQAVYGKTHVHSLLRCHPHILQARKLIGQLQPSNCAQR